MQTLKKHYDPKPSEILQRFKFHTCVRKPGETVDTYVAELRALAEHCNFGETLEVMLRDRPVCRIGDDSIQKRLLAESTLDYKRALEMARGLEVAAKNLKELRNGNGHEVHRMHASKGDASKKDSSKGGSGKGSSGSKAGECYRCGKTGHLASQCKYKDAECHQCGKIGHLKQVCHNKSKGKGPKKESSGNPSQPVRRVQDEDDLDEEVNLCHIGSRTSLPPIKVQVKVDDCLLSMDWGIYVIDVRNHV